MIDKQLPIPILKTLVVFICITCSEFIMLRQKFYRHLLTTSGFWRTLDLTSWFIVSCNGCMQPIQSGPGMPLFHSALALPSNHSSLLLCKQYYLARISAGWLTWPQISLQAQSMTYRGKAIKGGCSPTNLKCHTLLIKKNKYQKRWKQAKLQPLCSFAPVLWARS